MAGALLVLITESMGQLIETSMTDVGLPSSMGGAFSFWPQKH